MHPHGGSAMPAIAAAARHGHACARREMCIHPFALPRGLHVLVNPMHSNSSTPFRPSLFPHDHCAPTDSGTARALAHRPPPPPP
eukprot:363609-Chlamydomonas_euryale.AAC.14